MANSEEGRQGSNGSSDNIILPPFSSLAQSVQLPPPQIPAQVSYLPNRYDATVVNGFGVGSQQALPQASPLVIGTQQWYQGQLPQVPVASEITATTAAPQVLTVPPQVSSDSTLAANGSQVPPVSQAPQTLQESLGQTATNIESSSAATASGSSFTPATKFIPYKTKSASDGQADGQADSHVSGNSGHDVPAAKRHKGPGITNCDTGIASIHSALPVTAHTPVTPVTPPEEMLHTTRFYKYFTGAKNGGSNNLPGFNYGKGVHHYNPFIFPQNKSRVSAPIDFIPHSRTGKYETGPISTQAPEKIPTLFPSIKEYSDPLKYIESVRWIGEKYGAVKIVPPPECAPQFSANLDVLWFKTRRQLWNSPVNDLNARLAFHEKLLKVLPRKLVMSKLPSIDKRPIDLYRLHRLVTIKGGFERCCSEKMWAQVGRELGFYGKITFSLSSSIKSAYQRYLLPIDLSEKQTLQFKSPEVIKRQPALSPDPVPRISGAAPSVRRPLKKLHEDGFNGYFDQATTQKPDVTVNSEVTLPAYDFANWHHSPDVEDVSPYETRISPLYNIKQCKEKSQVLKKAFLEQFSVDPQDPRYDDPSFLEHAFWFIFNDPENMFETEAAVKTSTKIHPSGFDTKPGRDPTCALDPWNLNNLPVCKDSLLQFLDTEVESVVQPSLSLGMFFGVQGWNCEDHWLSAADYQHMGDPRIWYFIAPEDHEKFEKLLKYHFELRDKEDAYLSDAYKQFFEKVESVEIYNVTLENRVLADEHDERVKLKDGQFRKFQSPRTRLPFRHWNDDIFLSPQYLRQNGIRVYSCVQEPGEFIVRFPKSFASNISLGTSVSESVNFATPSWLSYSQAALRWLQMQMIIPAFSNFRLLTNIARKCDDRKTLAALKPVLEAAVDRELSLRTTVRSKSTSVGETTKIPFDWQQDELHFTDSSLADTYPSFVLLTDKSDKTKQFTMCMPDFINNFDFEDEATKPFKAHLVTYLTDDGLRALCKSLDSRLVTPEDWLSSYKSAIDGYDKPSIKIVSRLVADAEPVFVGKETDHSTEAYICYKNAKEQIRATKQWAERANVFLQFNVTSRMRQRNAGDDAEDSYELWSNVEDLDGLLKEIPSLSVSTPEIDQLIALADEINNFNNQVSDLLHKSKTSGTTAELKNLHLVGQSFGVKLDSFFLIDRIVKRDKWQLKVDRAFQRRQQPKERIAELVEEGERVGTSEDKSRIDSMKVLLKEGEQAEADYTEFVNADKVTVAQQKDLLDRVSRLPVDLRLKLKLTEKAKELESARDWKHDGATLDELVRKQKVLGRYSDTADEAAELGSAIESIRSVSGKIDAVDCGKDLHIFGEPVDNDDYCLCMQHHEDDAMVECETCKEWFHFLCLGLKEGDEEQRAKLESMDKYLCPVCDDGGVFVTTGYLKSAMLERPTVDSLEKVRRQVEQLPVRTAELEEYVKWVEAAKRFGETLESQDGNAGKKILRFRLRQIGGCSVQYEKQWNALKSQLGSPLPELGGGGGEFSRQSGESSGGESAGEGSGA